MSQDSNSSSSMDLGLRYDIRILQSLRQIVRYTELHSRYLATHFKVTAPQLVCLLTLRQTEPQTSSSLAAHMFLSASTVVGILDRLEEKKLIERKRSDSDRRIVEISLTSAGHKLLEECPSPLQTRLFSAMEALPELERSTIALALERIVQMMGAQDTEAEPILVAGPLNPGAEASKMEDIK